MVGIDGSCAVDIGKLEVEVWRQSSPPSGQEVRVMNNVDVCVTVRSVEMMLEALDVGNEVTVAEEVVGTDVVVPLGTGSTVGGCVGAPGNDGSA